MNVKNEIERVLVLLSTQKNRFWKYKKDSRMHMEWTTMRLELKSENSFSRPSLNMVVPQLVNGFVQFKFHISQTWVNSLLYPALWYPIPPSEAIRPLGASEVVLARWTMGLSGLQSSSTMPDILFDLWSCLRGSFCLRVSRVSARSLPG